MDRIIDFFLDEPEKEFHVRQIAKLVEKSPTTVSKYLKKLEKENFLISEKKLNHLFFKANSENNKFKIIKLNYNLNGLFNSDVIDYLVKEFNYPEAIVLFGSFAKAENVPKSDIDLLIITSLKKEIELKKFEKKLGHKIQLFIYSKKEIEKMKNKDLLNNFINGIVVYGFLEVFK